MHPLESVVLPTVIENDLADIPPFGRRLAVQVLDTSNNRNHAAEGGDHANALRYNQWRPAVQGYLASITFADAQVGKVLDALANSPQPTIRSSCSGEITATISGRRNTGASTRCGRTASGQRW